MRRARRTRRRVRVRCLVLVDLISLPTPSFLRVDALDQGREQKNHIPPLIHDGRPAVGALYLAGEVVGCRFGRGVIPAKVVVAVCEVDVFFMEDGCPLEG